MRRVYADMYHEREKAAATTSHLVAVPPPPWIVLMSAASRNQRSKPFQVTQVFTRQLFECADFRQRHHIPGWAYYWLGDCPLGNQY